MITEAQRKERINYLGSSDAAAVLGLSRWKTPLQVWAEKTGQIDAPAPKNQLAIEVGNELEDLCAKLFERRTGKKVRRMTKTVFHPQHPFIAANLDRVVEGEDAVLEIKTAGEWAAKDWGGDEIPDETIIQTLHQMAVTGRKKGYACCLIGGNRDFVWREVDGDAQVIKDITTKEVQFWERFVVPRVMPAVTKLDGDTLYSLFPEADEGAEVGLEESANALFEALDAFKVDRKSIDGQVDRVRNELKALLGPAAIGRTDRFLVTWKNMHRKAYTVAATSYRDLRYRPIKKEAE